MTRFFPFLQIFISLAAAGVYAYYGDWRRAVYWIAGAVLTTTVTY